MQINTVHQDPAILASKGHVRIAITHAAREPAAMFTRADTPQERRRTRREKLKAQRREISRGGSILPFLTTVQRGQQPHGRPAEVGFAE